MPVISRLGVIAIGFSVLAFARQGLAAHEFRHCAEELAVQVLDEALTIKVESFLRNKHGIAPAPTAAMVRALNRRMAFFRGYQAKQLWNLPEVCESRGICDVDSLLLTADLVESLPSASDPYRSVSNLSPFPDSEGNWGAPFMLDILTLPAARVAEYLRRSDFSGTRPKINLVVGEARPLPPAIDIAKTRAKADAVQHGWNFVMENRNGTFTPQRLKPLAGAYLMLSGGSMSSGSPGGTPPAIPQGAQFAVIDDRTGGLRFVSSQPKEPRTEFVILLNGQVIRHGVTEGGVKENALRLRNANVLMELLLAKGSFEDELTIYHREALYVVLERISRDLIAEETNLNVTRDLIRARWFSFLETIPIQLKPTGMTFLEGVKLYLEERDPLRKIHSLNELMPLL